MNRMLLRQRHLLPIALLFTSIHLHVAVAQAPTIAPAWKNIALIQKYLQAFPILRNFSAKELGLPEGVNFRDPMYDATRPTYIPTEKATTMRQSTVSVPTQPTTQASTEADLSTVTLEVENPTATSVPATFEPLTSEPVTSELSVLRNTSLGRSTASVALAASQSTESTSSSVWGVSSSSTRQFTASTVATTEGFSGDGEKFLCYRCVGNLSQCQSNTNLTACASKRCMSAQIMKLDAVLGHVTKVPVISELQVLHACDLDRSGNGIDSGGSHLEGTDRSESVGAAPFQYISHLDLTCDSQGLLNTYRYQVKTVNGTDYFVCISCCNESHCNEPPRQLVSTSTSTESSATNPTLHEVTIADAAKRENATQDYSLIHDATVTSSMHQTIWHSDETSVAGSGSGIFSGDGGLGLATTEYVVSDNFEGVTTGVTTMSALYQWTTDELSGAGSGYDTTGSELLPDATTPPTVAPSSYPTISAESYTSSIELTMEPTASTAAVGPTAEENIPHEHVTFTLESVTSATPSGTVVTYLNSTAATNTVGLLSNTTNTTNSNSNTAKQETSYYSTTSATYTTSATNASVAAFSNPTTTYTQRPTTKLEIEIIATSAYARTWHTSYTAENNLSNISKAMSKQQIEPNFIVGLFLLIPGTQNLTDPVFIEKLEANLEKAYEIAKERKRTAEQAAWMSRKLLAINSSKETKATEANIISMRRMTNHSAYSEFAVAENGVYIENDEVVSVYSVLSLDEFSEILGIPVLSPVLANAVETASAWLITSVTAIPILLLITFLLCCIKCTKKNQNVVKEIGNAEEQEQSRQKFYSPPRKSFQAGRPRNPVAPHFKTDQLEVKVERKAGNVEAKSLDKVEKLDERRTSTQRHLEERGHDDPLSRYVTDDDGLFEGKYTEENLPNSLVEKKISQDELYKNEPYMQMDNIAPPTAYPPQVRFSPSSLYRLPRVSPKATPLVMQPAIRTWTGGFDKAIHGDGVAEIEADLRMRTRMRRMQRAEQKRNKRMIREKFINRDYLQREIEAQPITIDPGIHNPFAAICDAPPPLTISETIEEATLSPVIQNVVVDQGHHEKGRGKRHRRKVLMTILKEWEQRQRASEKLSTETDPKTNQKSYSPKDAEERERNAEHCHASQRREVQLVRIVPIQDANETFCRDAEAGRQAITASP